MELVGELNEAFRLEDEAVEAALRWGEAPEGQDKDEAEDMRETGETLRNYAAELYANLTAHNRVAGRLGVTKKPTQLEIPLATRCR